MKNIGIIAIDMQNDFCRKGGSLYVNGAEDDVKRAARFIMENCQAITDITASMDWHPAIHVSFPNYWELSESGSMPEPFTEVTIDMLRQGEIRAIAGYKETERYLKYLKDHRNRKLSVWPAHCVQGTEGANLSKELSDAINGWANTRLREPCIILKGDMEDYEQYSAFGKEHYDPEGKFVNSYNRGDSFESCEDVIFFGEASDVCCRETLMDMISFKDSLLPRLVIFEDCMSSVSPKFSILDDPVYMLAAECGARIMRSIDYGNNMIVYP